eukprot:Clim_evm93s128 gene=Clim_evmTU93s128
MGATQSTKSRSRSASTTLSGADSTTGGVSSTSSSVDTRSSHHQRHSAPVQGNDYGLHSQQQAEANAQAIMSLQRALQASNGQAYLQPSSDGGWTLYSSTNGRTYTTHHISGNVVSPLTAGGTNGNAAYGVSGITPGRGYPAPGRQNGARSSDPSAEAQAEMARRMYRYYRRPRKFTCNFCQKTLEIEYYDEHTANCVKAATYPYNEEPVGPELHGRECSICFEDFESGQRLARLECFCVYHKKCLTEWLQTRACCPEHPDLEPSE